MLDLILNTPLLVGIYPIPGLCSVFVFRLNQFHAIPITERVTGQPTLIAPCIKLELVPMKNLSLPWSSG